MLTYVRNIYDSVRTTLKGMGVTFLNLRRPETTVQYPEELCELKEGYRGIHTLDQDICILCFQCSKICPVDCIEMEASRVEKKFLSWDQFTVDYNKCLFCDLCVEVCPKVCIHMDKREGSAEFALISDDRSTLNLDLLTYRGLGEANTVAAEKAKQARLAKEAADAEKKATEKKAPEKKAPEKKAPAKDAKTDAKAEAEEPAADKAADKKDDEESSAKAKPKAAPKKKPESKDE